MDASAKVRIFSMVGCSYCAKAKARLTQESVPFLELDIDLFPTHHKQAQEVNGIFTVPVIYFGPKLVGGNDKLQEIPVNQIQQVIDQQGSNASLGALPAFLQLTEEEIAEAERKKAERINSPRESGSGGGSPNVDLPGLPMMFPRPSGSITYREVLAILKGPHGPKLANRGGIVCAVAKNCATGKDIVTCLAEQLWNGDRAMGMRFGTMMMKTRMFVPADPESEKLSVETESASTPASDSVASKLPPQPVVLNSQGKNVALQDMDSVYYHFQVDKATMASHKSLNTHRIYNPFGTVAAAAASPALKNDNNGGGENFGRTADVVAFDLRKRLSALLAEFMDVDGRWVDYKAMGKSTHFLDFQDATAELQAVDITKLSREGLISFGINVYNSCIIHAFATIGPAGDSMWAKYKFFNNVGYTIGQHRYSLNDIENGILRGNRKAVGAFSVPFAAKDPRHLGGSGVVNPVDHRIHFALNCGAKSCPAIKVFTEEGLDDKLQLASKGFLETSAWDPEKNTLTVTKIVDWYSQDFQPDAVLALAPYLKEGESIRAAHAKKKVKLVFSEYDWSTNAKPEQ